LYFKDISFCLYTFVIMPLPLCLILQFQISEIGEICGSSLLINLHRYVLSIKKYQIHRGFGKRISGEDFGIRE